MSERSFIPCTMVRAIGDGVFFRPIRSWHSGTYAGEKRYKLPGTDDRSGCLYGEKVGSGLTACSPPLSVTHRLYWHESDPAKTISAFLSYPDGMGCSTEYFWEALGATENDDVDRWFGDNAEVEMETAIKAQFAKALK